MRKILLFFSIFLIHGLAIAQLTENFNDGDFTTNPEWTGDVSLFKVNTAFQLQLNASADGIAALSVPVTVEPEMEWSCWVKLAFAPSDNNLARIYLFSDQQDLKGSLNGYYIKLGEAGSNDAIELVRQSGTTHTVVCRGTNAFVAAAFAIKVKVIRTSGGNWSIYADQTGGNNYSFQASGTDETYATGSYSGVYCKYTSSNGTKFYFDDFFIGPYVPDTTPPQVLSVKLDGSRQLTVEFNEVVDASSAVNIGNYTSSPGLVHPATATIDALSGSTVHLTFNQDFTPDVAYLLDVANIADLSGNILTTAQTPFSWHRAKTYDVLINEIMADPTPPVNLPEAEYVELYNRSAFAVDMQNWVLWLGKTAKTFPKYTLPAGGYVILCTTSAKTLLAPYGNVVDFSSFAVTNGAGTITLKDNMGEVIHTASYTLDWFLGSDKKDGGWSLELVDPLNPCGEGSNWLASISEFGGTPGKVNSVNAPNPDHIAPAISRVDVNDTTHITVWFTESCDSATMQILSNYTIDNGIGHPIAVATHSPDYKMVNLTLPSRLAINIPYTLTLAGNITDCAGNLVATGTSAQFTVVVDVMPPQVVSATAEASNRLVVFFNEAVDAVSATNTANYSVIPGALAPVSATRDQSDPTLVHLVFGQDFTSDHAYTLAVSNIADLSGNVLNAMQVPFSWHQAKSFDVLINEIMADPTPPVGLPEAEYVELYNRSAYPLYLQNWVLMLGNTPKTLPKYTIPAGGYLILCDDGAKTLLAPYGSVIDFSSFAVTNGSGTIVLKDNIGNLIHSVSYTPNWYSDSYKKDGGWSLELIDPANPCGEAANWAASSNAAGGTPGQVNSVNAPNPDNAAPSISRVGVNDDTHITVWFTESCDSTNLQLPTNYTIDNGIGNPLAVDAISPEFKVSHLTLTSPLVTGVVYTLTCTSNIFDCAGNPLSASTSARFAIPLSTDSNDIVINELLYDPPAGCVDFVEIYNRSSKVLDLKDLALTNYDTVNHVVVHVNEISKEPFIILPGEYYTLTTDSTKVKKFYKSLNPKSFINMDGFPTMNNDAGIVAITKRNGDVVDMVTYNAAMQYPLLTSVDGVSLERISPDRPSKDVTNWHSAAEAVGYATPGYKNSQYSIAVADGNEFTLSPDIFSPDNDGHNDNLTIAYAFGEPGNNATITIYDASGRLVRNLVNHELCGTSGAFSWDGTTNDRTKGLIGRYIVLIEVFDMNGTVKRYKKSAVLGGKL